MWVTRSGGCSLGSARGRSDTVMWLNQMPGWFVTGTTTGVVAPLLLLAFKGRGDRVRLPATAVAAGFVLVHGAITLSLLANPPPLPWIGEHLVLTAAAMLYWAPVLARTRRLPGDIRFVYLLATTPSLDLAAVLVVGLGRPDDGIAMIVGMLPVNVVAVIVTWMWMADEERSVAGAPSQLALDDYNRHLQRLNTRDDGWLSRDEP